MTGVPKSQGLHEFVQVLFRELFGDLQRRHPRIRESLMRDWETFVSRFNAEGISFATKTLPRLGKQFDAALDTGSLEAPTSFKKKKGSRTIPAFLQGMYSVLFSDEGLLVGDDVSIIADMRQLFYLVYKLELPYSQEDCDRVIDTFLENENDLLCQTIGDFTEEADVCSEILHGFDPMEIRPRHGPGAVSTGEKLEEKWTFKRLYSEIHRVFPYYDYFIAGGATELLDRREWYRNLSRETIGVAKVVLVPKDSRGPRLISCEPLEYQWIQQGLNSQLVKHLEYGSSLTRGQINFKDQSINRTLARESSRHRFYCTLDLKDASDRVSLALVRKILPDHLIKYFEAVRSHATRLPDGRIVSLCKYAPMGSAVCFSVEALCFWVICVVAVRKRLKWTLREAARHVYVYGDDIIVPTIAFDDVVDALGRAGLKVNASKCCSNGSFRESCGLDAYNGVEVTPTRISTCWVPGPTSGDCLASYAAYANEFWRKGYYGLATFVRDRIQHSHGVLPHGYPGCGFPCIEEESLLEAHQRNSEKAIKARFNLSLQRVEYRVKTLVSFETSSTLNDWPRLLKNFVQPAVGCDPDVVVLPRRTKVRYRWRSLS